MIECHQQITNKILMLQPVAFASNPQTLVDNAFQQKGYGNNLQDLALDEFNNFVNLLRDNGVLVDVIQDTLSPHKPDSIFPNNWISFHENGYIIIYPMKAENRRLERRFDIINMIKSNYDVNAVIDMSSLENKGYYLEGTGSMVLDRKNKIAYTCLSQRTDIYALKIFGEITGYTIKTFNAIDTSGHPIYHTNVMMSIGDEFALICADSIENPHKNVLLCNLINTGHKIITITQQQMQSFAGNILQIQGIKKFIVMSDTAFNVLTDKQKEQFDCSILHTNLLTIETYGGGSARCMLAENFLQIK